MYIGDTEDGTGLHHMVRELLTAPLMRPLPALRYCFCHHAPREAITVGDNGRGVPVDMHPEKVGAAEVIMTTLHAGGKFDDNSYKVSGGLHGVGVSVVNALSDELRLTVRRNGKVYQQPTNMVCRWPPGETGETQERGTECYFRPSPERFITLNSSMKCWQNG